MSEPGFIISLDNLSDYGNRNNWCTTQAWWTNQSIQLSGSSNNASAQVGENVTIQVEVRGTTFGEPDGATHECQVNSIQAWVCYPNTVPGTFSSQSLIVSSMNPTNPNRSLPPTLAKPAICFTGAPDDPAPATTGFLSLTPTWVPTSEDLLPPNQTGHCCVVATCAGIYDVNGDKLPVGAVITNDNITEFNICNDPHQGQRNVTILPAPQGRRFGNISFGFLSGIANPDRRGAFTVDINPLPLREGIDPVTRGILESSPYKNLPLKPSNLPLKGLKLKKNTHKCHGWLEKIICEAEEILEDVIEGVEHLIGCDGKGTRLHVKLPHKGTLTPLVVEAELDEKEELGAVHAFDITQTDKETGERGGYRIAIVVVP